MACNLRVHGEPGTLYARCGGAFGVASFVDHCMDKWMEEPILNANRAVASWHQKRQRCGFKFLTAQYLCDRTGGPHRYTGRPMELAHKHLNIQTAEWDTFMNILSGACLHFGLDPETTGELHSLFTSVKDACVVHEGENVPPNPGPTRVSGQSLYAQLGGVYPIALFTDRLVDGLLADDRLHLPYDGTKRNEASLKFFFTEVVCNILGGPEALTCRDYDETKLLVPGSEWFIFLSTAEAAADHFPEALQMDVVKALQHAKHLIVDPANADDVASPAAVSVSAARVKDVQAAAAGKKVSKAVIEARLAAPGEHVAARRRVYGDPRTLYGRGGGVFGLARLSCRLMDVWMSNPGLNANHMVARWHESQQKYGFKFLVTQIMGYLTGGPQRYTGRSMEMAHKHLAISGQQWDYFVADAERVFQEFGMEPRTRRELVGLIQGFRNSCVLGPEERAPPDPGPSQPNASLAGTLFFRLGGVYPIARFVDQLVDAVLADGEMHVDSEAAGVLNGRRQPPGLKYLMTELVCRGTGGEEVVTSQGLDEAKLGVLPDEWLLFMKHAQKAGEMWCSGLRTELLGSLESLKAEICTGTIQEESLPHGEAFHRLRVAGHEVDLASGARGGRPGDRDEEAAKAANEGSNLPGSVHFCCPFAYHFVHTDSGRPPGHGGAQLARDQPACLPPSAQAQISVKPYSPATATEEEVRSRPAPQEKPEALWHDSSKRGMVSSRTLGSSLQDKLDELLSEDPGLCCPISLMLYAEPAQASDGFVYESASIKVLSRSNMVSPMSNEHVTGDFTVAKEIKSRALNFRKARSSDLLKFVAEAGKSEPEMAVTGLERVGEYIQVLKPQNVPELVGKAAKHWQDMNMPVPPELVGGSVRRRTKQSVGHLESSGDLRLSRSSAAKKSEADFRAHLNILLNTENAAPALGRKLYERYGGRLENVQKLLQFLEDRWGFPQRLTPLLWTHLRRAVFARRGAHLHLQSDDAATAGATEVEEEEWVDAFIRWLQALAARCCQAQVSRETWVQKFDDSIDFGGMYFQGPKLGEGAYGEVFLMFHKKLNEERTVKVIRRDQMSMSAEDVEAEVNILKSLDHPNVVRLYESFEKVSNLYIVMDYAEGGDLASVLQQVHAKEKSCTELWSRTVTEQVLAALEYIHSKGIIHCDLKPANTMLLRPVDMDKMEAPHVLLADFGLSELFVERHKDGPVQVKGTPVYLSPEAFEGHLTDKSDMWALGIMAFELLLGRRPFKDCSVFALWNKVARTEPPLDELPPAAREVVKRLLKKDPLSRPKAAECRALQWFSCTSEGQRPTQMSKPSALLASGGENLTYFRRAAMFCMAAELSMKDMDDVYQVFQEVDKDKTGSLSLAELAEALDLLGIKQDPAELMEMLDLDQNGSLSYTEFLAGSLCSRDSAIPEQLLRHAFDMFDLDGDGAISRHELRMMLSGGGPLVDMLPDGQTVCEILEEVSNGTGHITFESFRSYLNGDTVAPANPRQQASNREVREHGVSKMFRDLDRTSSRLSAGAWEDDGSQDSAKPGQKPAPDPQACGAELPPLLSWLQAALGDSEGGLCQLLRFPGQLYEGREAAQAHLASITKHLLAGVCLVRMLAEDGAPRSLEQLREALPSATRELVEAVASAMDRPSRSACWPCRRRRRPAAK